LHEDPTIPGRCREGQAERIGAGKASKAAGASASDRPPRSMSRCARFQTEVEAYRLGGENGNDEEKRKMTRQYAEQGRLAKDLQRESGLQKRG
jgi:hypothetical protein